MMPHVKARAVIACFLFKNKKNFRLKEDYTQEILRTGSLPLGEQKKILEKISPEHRRAFENLCMRMEPFKQTRIKPSKAKKRKCTTPKKSHEDAVLSAIVKRCMDDRLRIADVRGNVRRVWKNYNIFHDPPSCTIYIINSNGSPVGKYQYPPGTVIV